MYALYIFNSVTTNFDDAYLRPPQSNPPLACLLHHARARSQSNEKQTNGWRDGSTAGGTKKQEQAQTFAQPIITTHPKTKESNRTRKVFPVSQNLSFYFVFVWANPIYTYTTIHSIYIYIYTLCTVYTLCSL